ncbi:transcription factor bHLH90 isoform X2 [Manihot esculenta]|uniref:Uncharacterized protein n=2 Tax=Manihot esculenta TaxID=3983 RepID=A0ACB7GP78_MANES|nr:transcription factor bHLH90 isoform X2 [Manihot esculenta]KAG8641724.1 hypothetical protein MANES_12G028000v8 [Manihot esculenta]
MRSLEGALEWLRPFVASKAWDYCVVWKLGDDPSRFIQWMGCCCGGGGNVKEERGGENNSAALCRDLYFKHPIRTKACEALACFPSFMPLYSGIHGEVVTSTQSKWITHANASDSNLSPELIGTRVLIPVFGGLIELFAGQHIAKDQKIIEFITAHFNVLKQEASIAHDYASINELYLDSFPEHNLQNLQPPSHLSSLIPPIHIHHPLNQPNNHSSFEGSSSVSNPSNEHSSFDSHSGGYLSRKGILKQSIGKPYGKRKSGYDEDLLKQQAGLIPESNNEVAKVIQRSERDHFRSKNLVTERNRRNRMKDGLFTLRALVPKISKMNKAAILGDAIDYIGELQNEEKKLQDELKEIEEQECKNSTEKIITSRLESLREDSKYLPPTEKNQYSSGFGDKKKTEVQIELNQIGKREFLIKLFYEHKRGGFGKLMDAIHSLGLQVVDANMTTFNGKVLNILKVEATVKDIQPRKLKESLLKLGG